MRRFCRSKDYTIAAVLLMSVLGLGACSWDELVGVFYKSGEKYCERNPHTCDAHES